MWNLKYDTNEPICETETESWALRRDRWLPRETGLGEEGSWEFFFFLPHSSSSVSRSVVWLGEGDGTPLQYSCLENPMDGGAWWAAVHGVAEGWTRLSGFTFTFHFHALEKEMATHSSVLAWRIPGTGSLVGCRLWGRTESDTTEAT